MAAKWLRFFLAWLSFFGLMSAYAQADNDDFGNAFELGTEGTFVARNFDSTFEEGELPSVFGSVWYKWQAPGSGVFQLSGGVTATLYTGNEVAKLQKIEGVYSTVTATERWPVRSGEVYHLAINAPFVAAGSYMFLQTGGSDSFGSRPLLGTNFVVVEISNTTREPDEPFNNGAGSTWWSVPSVATGSVALIFRNEPLVFRGEPLGTFIVYEGETLNELKEVTRAAGSLTNQLLGFNVEAGKQYSVAFVCEDIFQAGNVIVAAAGSTMQLQLVNPTDRATIGQPIDFSFVNIPEPVNGETILRLYVRGGPELGSWSPPFPGQIQVTNLPPGTDSLQLVLQDPKQVIAAAGITVTVVPSNDAFQDRIALQGTNGDFEVPLGGTAEPGEPFGWGFILGSVWYEWAPPEDGVFIVNFPVPELYVNVANQLSSLQSVPGIFATNFYWSSYWRPTGFIVSKGSTYELSLTRDPRTSQWCSFYFYPRPRQNNDRIANAFELSGTALSFISSALGGTLEPREPSSLGLNASVWYKWVAPDGGVIQVSIGPRELRPPTDIALFRKTDLLIPVPPTYPVRAQVQQGELIYIQHLADALDYYGSLISLNFFPTPENDDFQNAELLEGEKGEFNVDTSGATNEPEELDKGLAPGIWYRWVAPTNGLLHISPSPSFVAFMSGVTLEGLTNVPSISSFSRLFPVQSGNSYYIRVAYDDYYYFLATAKYDYEFFPGLDRENDTFEDGLLLSGTSIRVSFLTAYATRSNTDPVEVEPDGSKHDLANTVWFDWIAPVSGWTTVSTRKLLDYYIADDSRTLVFTGNTASNLTEVATSNGNTGKLEFRAEKGERYHFMVGEFGSEATAQTTGALLSMELSVTAMQVSAPTNGTVIFDDQILSCDVLAADSAAEGEVRSVKYSIIDKALGWVMAQVSKVKPPFNVAISNLYAGNFELRAEVSAGDPAWIFALEPVVFSLRSHLVPFDFFEDRELLQGFSVERSLAAAQIAAATREEGEPRMTGNLATFWFRWIAPFDGKLVIGPGWLSTNIGIFEGDTLSNLVRIRNNIVSKGHEYELQMPASTAGFPLALRLDTLLAHPSEGVIYTESDVIQIDARTTAEPDVAEVTLFGNGQMLSVMTSQPFTAVVKLAPGIYNLQSVHRLQSGVLFTNEISDLFSVYAGNITPDGAILITNSQGTIDARGFTPDLETGGAFLNGPPLYYRIKPEATVFAVAQASLEVRVFTNQAAMDPIPTTDIYFTQESYGSPAFRLEAGGDYLLTVRSPESVNAVIDFHSPIPNDNFQDALVIPPEASEIRSDLYFSTVQAAERTNLPPELTSIHGSVWYRWTAPSSGVLGMEPQGYLFNGNDLEGLREIPRAFDEFYFHNVYRVISGTSYYIGVFPDFINTATVHLCIQTNDFLSNDSVTNAAPLLGTNVSQFYMFPRNATYEPGEDHRINGFDYLPGFGSLWWKWTAPANGEVRVNIGPSVRYRLYRRTETGRILVPAEFPNPRWKVESGKDYLLAVEEVDPPPAQADNKYFDRSISLDFSAFSANDAFASRQSLTGESLQLVIPPYRGSREFGEPLHAGEYGGQSLWYSWRAPFSGSVRVDALWTFAYGWPTGGLVGIYQGDDLRSLKTVSSIGSEHSTNFTTFDAIEGTIYQIAIDNAGLTFPLTLLIRQDIPIVEPLALKVVGISSSFELDIEMSPKVSASFTVESSTNLMIWTSVWKTNLNDHGEFSLPIGTNGLEVYRVRREN